MTFANLVEIKRPQANLELSCQAAELILGIGNYIETKDVPKILADMVGRTTIVALDVEERVVGTAGLRIVSAGLGFLEDVVSDPDKRGCGIGRGVVNAVEELATKKGVREINLGASMTAIAFYSRLGYHKLDDRLGDHILRKYL